MAAEAAVHADGSLGGGLGLGAPHVRRAEEELPVQVARVDRVQVDLRGRRGAGSGGDAFSARPATAALRAGAGRRQAASSADVGGCGGGRARAQLQQRAHQRKARLRAVREAGGRFEGDVRMDQQEDRIELDIDDVETSIDAQSLDVKSTLSQVEKDMAEQEQRNRQNIKDVRGVINAFEIRMDAKIDRLDTKIETLELNLDNKIKKALLNPLAGN